VPDALGIVQEAVAGATVLVFCAPHQFIGGIVRELVGSVAEDAIAISLTKVGQRAL
jgi:glycerol-3-phosphate dehydrogenase (NAD+)